MRIAIFNWRDIRHPLAGGAEVFVQRLSERLIAMGHGVTVFSGTFPGCANEEEINGVRVIRFGGRFTMYLKAYSCYRKHIRGRFDIILESINGMPFFSPLFAKEKTVSFIHQLTRENWYSGLPWPLAFLGYHLEDSLLFPYRKRPSLVPSESTASDLRKLGFTDVGIIPEAADIVPPEDAKKEKIPTMIYLGRLAKSKRVDHAMLALKRILEKVPGARLWIAGSGSDEKRLRALAQSHGLHSRVTFFGKVSAEKKAELLSRSHLLLFPGTREGWGLVVLEANACGTPAIGYDVPGLRDSIQDGINGSLVPDGDFSAMAEKAGSLLLDGRALTALSRRAAEHSRKFTWEGSAEAFLSFVKGF